MTLQFGREEKKPSTECGPYLQSLWRCPYSVPCVHVLCNALEHNAVMFWIIFYKNLYRRYCACFALTFCFSLVPCNFNSTIISQFQTSFFLTGSPIYSVQIGSALIRLVQLFRSWTVFSNRPKPIKKNIFDYYRKACKCAVFVWFICSISIFMRDNFHWK